MNPDDASYCHKCGSSLYREAARHSDQSTRDAAKFRVKLRRIKTKPNVA
ncbi:MAG: hypothetical protein DMG54_32855 [Acidobacteria bacterium]|nr:MAG: hypothetical protein DMG54_32855 [Acidobacteriota bacterium]PYU76752.1 MAG: hypothetical protein DMG52_02995 [Acidobacteriota bacterium]